VKEKKTTEVFSMSFLDIMACGFGALVLILLISEFNEIEIIENTYTAELFLKKQDEVVTKTNQLNEVDKELTSKLRNLISIQEELEKVKNYLTNRTTVVESLTELSQLKESQIIVKKEDQKEPEEQVVASGIRIDSKYLIFIIDNSGSMVEGAPWSRVVKEIETIITTFPSLEGLWS
jgi:tRNA U34 5-carboxymethylaminomethyl modifying enzyme MnmG/GidA